MAKFDPEHATVPNTNFSDRNSAERFLECGKFRRCANLLLPLVHQASPPVNVYVPICAESRFNKEGVAQHLLMPNPASHTVSPIVYTTVGQWAPLISCPRKCKGYRNKYWAALTHTVRKMFRGNVSDNPTPKWNRGEKIAGWTLVIGALALIAAVLVVPEVRRFLRLQREPSSIPTPTPTTTTPATADKVFGMSAESVEELRKHNNVTRIKDVESGKMLSEIPAGSFGFADDIEIRRSLRDSRIEELALKPHAPDERFELHKLLDGQIELVGYVGPETLEHARSGLSQGEAITFFSDTWTDAANIVAVPLARLSCSRGRTLLLGDPKNPKNRRLARLVTALDCKVE